ncbi:MAG: hypothetical protein HGA19_23025 [Oscillochloris sp.]|nr:hypothetical protein [Oscillochloris sp.]
MTLSGKNFGTDSTVTIGGVSAAISSLTNTSVTVTIPSAAGYGDSPAYGGRA